jgi:hypothetical protein
MCCVFTILLFFGPRLAILIWWLINRIYINTAVGGNWILSILAWIFLPWTLLMYLVIAPGGVVGFDWIWLGLGLLADLASYAGGGWGNRDRLRGY